MASTGAVDRLDPVVHRANWDSWGTASGHSADHRPSVVAVAARTGLVGGHPGADSRWEATKDDRHSVDMVDLARADRQAGHRLVVLVELPGAVAPLLLFVRCLPPFSAPSIPCGFP